MPTPFPIWSPTTKEDKVDDASASDINDIQGEIVDIETALANIINTDGSLRQGSSFPGSPVTGQLFYRTDLQAIYVYSGTGWALTVFASNIQIFTSDGTFTAPAGITKVYLSMVGGGGGGGCKSGAVGGGGGAGAMIVNYPYTVVPGNNYAVVIGPYGAGGAGTTEHDGANGTATTFDSTVSASGGNGGKGAAGTGGTGAGGFDATSSGVGTYTMKGGDGSSSANNGHGGGTFFGVGGVGAVPTGNPAPNNSGGGGGGGRTDGNGGNGGAGICIVMY